MKDFLFAPEIANLCDGHTAQCCFGKGLVWLAYEFSQMIWIEVGVIQHRIVTNACRGGRRRGVGCTFHGSRLLSNRLAVSNWTFKLESWISILTNSEIKLDFAK